ncbi:acyltransferase [Dictyobacter formicarum]|uniref:Acyltransferase n=1 Tax=Dictyobacter formicarum TaxID=2778368 RepID=A0ABQ3VJR1_9CHLR|nr:acyltransferase [Dictyobacter formicarum]GHO86152.1 acyltransferase [Dictyobacter formicarum]
MSQEKNTRRPYIYELDLLRVITMLTVIAVHITALSAYINTTTTGLQIQNALVNLLHANRAIFMFITAFALIYVYYGKSLQVTQFWKKRSLGILLPYVSWSILYEVFKMPHDVPWPIFFRVLAVNTLTGQASFQLYFILISIQFYIIFPFFLAFMKKVARHPWTVLLISFALEVAFLYTDYHTIQMGRVPLVGFWHYYARYSERCILSYQFYFVLGGITAIYLPQVRAFLLRHGRLVVSCAVIAVAAFTLHYIVQVRVYQEPIAHATAVTQPMIAIYSPCIIFFLFWLASHWSLNASQQHPPRGYKFWHMLSDTSFGVYLCHAFVLTIALTWLIPELPTSWPVALRVLLAWLFTASISVTFCVVLLRIPVLSRLIGREVPKKSKSLSAHNTLVEPNRDVVKAGA